MNARVKLHGSDKIAAEIQSLVQERDASDDRIIELNNLWNAVLLSGDDARAEAHEAEKARLSRALARADLRLAALKEELAAAKASEEAQRHATRQAEASAVVDQATSDDAVAEYYDAARKIASFLRSWEAATEQARAAGVPTPSDRLRTRQERREAPREETYATYIDEGGNEVASAYGTVQFDHEDEDGIRYLGADRRGDRIRIEPRQMVRRTRRVRANYIPLSCCLTWSRRSVSRGYGSTRNRCGRPRKNLWRPNPASCWPTAIPLRTSADHGEPQPAGWRHRRGRPAGIKMRRLQRPGLTATRQTSAAFLVSLQVP